MRSIAIAVILSFFTPAICHANAAALSRLGSPWGGGRLHVAKENGLKIQKETVTFNIQSDDWTAVVRVVYEIVNTRDKPFDGTLFFIVPSTDDISDLDIYLGQNSVRYEKIEGAVKDVAIQRDINQHPGLEMSRRVININRYSGYRFPFRMKGDETKTVVFEYTQEHGYDTDENTPSAASNSHWLNMVRPRGTPKTINFSYYLFPILTFSEGVEEIVIRVTHPKRFKNIKLEDFQSNIRLKKKYEDKYTCTYEGHFKEVPENIFVFSFYSGRWPFVGFTLYPAYRLALPDKHHAFSIALTVDAIIRNVQLSIGAQYATVNTFQLTQEAKLFPPGAATGMAAFFDYRFSFGVVEQLVPNLDVGFKVSAGIRIFLALELTYQMFPPMVTDDWTHELLIGMPFSF